MMMDNDDDDDDDNDDDDDDYYIDVKTVAFKKATRINSARLPRDE